jgi:nitroreductase
MTLDMTLDMTESSYPAVQVQSAATLMQVRQTILPKRLQAPGPNEAQLQILLGAAASAPDHRQLLPWRFVLVPTTARERLAQVFAQALVERDANALPEQVVQAREKAHRAPLLLLLVVDEARGDLEVSLHERTLSAGCAVQNMLLMATAMGFGSALTSGKALTSKSFRQLFGLTSSELALCFISVGTANSSKPSRIRPKPADYVSVLADQ